MRSTMRSAFRPMPLGPLPDDEFDGPIINIDEPVVVPRTHTAPSDLFDEEDDSRPPLDLGMHTPVGLRETQDDNTPLIAPPRAPAGNALDEADAEDALLPEPSSNTFATPAGLRAPSAPGAPPRAGAIPPRALPLSAPPETTPRATPADPWASDAPPPTAAASAPFAAEAPTSAPAPVVPRPQAMPASTTLPGEDNEPLMGKKAFDHGPPPPEGLFGPTDAEQARLTRAETRDRRLNIARIALGTAGRVLGAIGMASGNRGLGAIGAATNQIGAGVGAGQGGADRARRAIAERVAATQGRQQYDTQQQAQNLAQGQAAQDAERQAALDAQRSEADAAQLELTRARTGAITGDASRAEAEAAMAQRGAAGLRDYIRGRVAAIPAGQTRAPLDDVVNSDSFNGIEDPEALYRVLSSVDAVDRRRGGQGVGGSGGSAHTETSIDAAGNVVQRRVGGGSSTRAPGGPRASVAPAEAAGMPTDAQGSPLDVNDPATIEPWIQRTLNRAGLRNQDTIAGYLLRWQQAPSDSARAAVLSEVGALAVQAERDDAGGIPAGVNPQEWQRMRQQLTPIAQQRSIALGLAGRIRRWSTTRPIALRAASVVSGGGDRSQFDAATLTQADDILSEILRYANPLLRERSGAAVTDGELRRFLGELSLGRLSVSPMQLAAAMDRQVDAWDDQIAESAADYDPRAVQAWTAAHLGGR